MARSRFGVGGFCHSQPVAGRRCLRGSVVVPGRGVTSCLAREYEAVDRPTARATSSRTSYARRRGERVSFGGTEPFVLPRPPRSPASLPASRRAAAAFGRSNSSSAQPRAKAGNAHLALGYKSWTAYLSDGLSDEPLRLARDERRELVGRLADPVRVPVRPASGDAATLSSSTALQVAGTCQSLVASPVASSSPLQGSDSWRFRASPPRVRSVTGRLWGPHA